MSEAPALRLRLDKWLVHARFCKTRSVAAAQVTAGHIRINGTRAAKPAQAIGPGDVLTLVQPRRVRVVRVEALGLRRGPASEAQTLYTELEDNRDDSPPNPGYEGKGRPGKRERRALDLSLRPGTD
ncbi:RNA-binding S4 domain-containing protein [Pseudodonghicola flavimaris]|uniref:RNA-binding S4 domain-containing protein n=1 Tax=Pseudodonghicola flavimaris TaxID=3050036 RepID=A0ABT7F547_9RHOB|nr:RNA-binding S4 domain-containing protein [Pseudodonghicola flavimaris]MDK3019729.1 RNA-binding S4 domain-containing protein [Pseudodonghicola flavimaris]